MSDLQSIDSRNIAVRIAVIVFVILSIALTWNAVRWQLGDLLAALTTEANPELNEKAELALRWAPSNPAAHSLNAAIRDPGGASESLETATRLAPNDYRLRTEFGRALEQDGQIARAEEQLRVAVELAPAYSAPRWHLGNFYLRQERPERAFPELRMAAQNDHRYREQVFSLIWDSSGKDPVQLERLAGDSAEMLARLAYFFGARGRADDSLRNWNRLSDEDKQKQSSLARSIALGLFDQKHFAEALEFGRQYGAETEASVEAISNPGFERPVGESNESRFGWVIERSDPRFEGSVDPRVRREGSRSFRGTFKSYSKVSFSNLLQTVVVESNRRYFLRFWVRTENLRSAGMPMIEVLNANDNIGIARSEPFSPGTEDWRIMTVEFTTPEDCRGILIRTIRAFCGEECPITGIFWYDDFELSRR